MSFSVKSLLNYVGAPALALAAGTAFADTCDNSDDEYWKERLLNHPLVSVGMRDDVVVRQESINSLDLPPIFDQFDAVTQEAFNAADPAYGDRLSNIIDDLPSGVQTVLYNAGVTHYLAAGEAEEIFNTEDNSDEAGAYKDSIRTAVTEADNRHGIEQVARHEAGHALSYALGNDDVILEPLAQALEKDLMNLSPPQWDILLKSFDETHLSTLAVQGSGSRMGLLAMGQDKVKYVWQDGLSLTSRHTVTLTSAKAMLKLDSEEIHRLFPNLDQAIKDNSFTLDTPLYSSFSRHPDMIEAYQEDLQRLLSGTHPDGLSLSQENGRAVLTKKDGSVISSLEHYVPKEHGGNGHTDLNDPEEPFANIFAYLVDPIGAYGKGEAFLEAFPSLTKEVQNVIYGLDQIYEASPSKNEPEIRERKGSACNVLKP